MNFGIQAVAVMLPGVVRVGALRIPVFGMFAAVGLVGALWLSQRTAKAAGVDADKLWDAGMFAVAAAFVVSRVLLIAMDVRAFWAYPLLVLSMPSLTYGGMALTGVLVWLWLRWKKIPLRQALDAWAPCAMVLWAALSLGHFVEGTDAGMPTKLPWGVVTPGDHVLGKVHPVQMYALAGALWLMVRALRLLGRPHDAGLVAGPVLRDGGLLFFVIDMVAQPTDVSGGFWLDPGQVVALASFAAGLWWTSRWLFAIPPRRELA